MKERIHILQVITEEKKELLLSVANEVGIENMIATGQMLVDSNDLAFIYLVEKNNDYTYINLDERIWDNLKQALDLHLPVYLVTESARLLLINFQEEIKYLISNIKGNSNYGEKMVAKVESTF